MQVEFIGNEHLLYSKNDSYDHQPLTRLTTLLKYPMCVSKNDIDELPNMLTAAENNPERINSFEVLRRIDEQQLSSIAQTLKIIANGEADRPKSDRVIRLLAHSLLVLNQPAAAADAWALISQPETRDLIYGAFANIKAERYARAEELLDLATSEPWQNYYPLTLAQTARLQTLGNMLNEAGYSYSSSALREILAPNPTALNATNTLISPQDVVYRHHCASLAFEDTGNSN